MKVKDIFNTMEYGPALESDAQAMDFLNSNDKCFQLFIDGEWKKPSSGVYFDTINPANEQVLAQIAQGNVDDVNLAVEAANKALPNWVKIGGYKRAQYLYALARQIQKNARLFSVLETLDNGKPIRESRDIDIPLVARHFYHHAGWAQLMDLKLPNYKEIGVVGQIIPWNFPLLMLAWKIAPALAMGNTVVLKPAEYTSLTALLFADICQKIHLPKGVINIVTGDGQTGEAIVKHPKIDKIAFTGSTEVGKIIRKTIAGTGKKVSLELGGKSPFIVFEDADLDSVVEGLVDAIWFNQGQVCCAGSRLLVQESVAEKLYKKIQARMQTLILGNPMDKCIDMGPVVDKIQLKTISDLVNIGKNEGCKIWQVENNKSEKGFFYPPTLFTDVSPSSKLAQEEIFGPVLVAMSFRSHKEAVALANNTRYGLAASLWTENINLALEIAPQIKSGTVWINCSNVFDAASGFGGYRESGFGREGGMEGLMEYVKPKNQVFGLNKPILPKKEKGVKVETIDRTAKNYVGGKQARPDNGYSINIKNANGEIIGEVPEGSRKDIRNAVEAAHASSWSGMTGHARAQVMYYIAENLSTRKEEFAKKISQMTLQSLGSAMEEVELSIQQIFTFAALADKYDGQVHSTVQRNVTLAMHEPIGVLGIICPDEFPLLAFVGSLMPALALGNSVVLIPSETAPFSATDFYQILDTSDVPAGTVNIITGNKNELAFELAKHNNVDGIWYFGDAEGSAKVESLSTENMKRSWVNYGHFKDWTITQDAEIFLQKACEVKNIWIPYGV